MMTPQAQASHDRAVPRYEKISRLRAEGYTYRQIAALWDISVQCAQQLGKRAEMYGYLQADHANGSH